MASIRRGWKEKDVVGRIKPDSRCKKHPKHRQSPGVCSLCLRGKLCQLSAAAAASSSPSSSASSSSLSSYYSSSASSCSSPTTLPFPFSTHPNNASNSLSIFLFTANHAAVLKSRSITLLPTTTKKQGYKSGFWSKLLRPKSKRMDEIKPNKLLHTRSLIETLT